MLCLPHCYSALRHEDVCLAGFSCISMQPLFSPSNAASTMDRNLSRHFQNSFPSHTLAMSPPPIHPSDTSPR